MIELFIYLCDVLPVLSYLLFGGVCAYVGIILFVTWMAGLGGGDSTNIWNYAIKNWLFNQRKILIPLFILGLIIPSEKKQCT